MCVCVLVCTHAHACMHVCVCACARTHVCMCAYFCHVYNCINLFYSVGYILLLHISVVDGFLFSHLCLVSSALILKEIGLQLSWTGEVRITSILLLFIHGTDQKGPTNSLCLSFDEVLVLFYL